MSAWKAFEREVAKAFGGIRNVRVSYGESDSDISLPFLTIECKWGKQVPKFFGDAPFMFGDYVVLTEAARTGKIGRRKPQALVFVGRGLTQAFNYDQRKIPVLCVKRPGMKGFRVIMNSGNLYDYFELRKKKVFIKQTVCDSCGQEIKFAFSST